MSILGKRDGSLLREAPEGQFLQETPVPFPAAVPSQPISWRTGTCLPCTCLRATHRQAAQGGDIRMVQELLGHKEVSTTMIYSHVFQRGPARVRGPADEL